MTRTKWTEIRDTRLSRMSPDERDEFDQAYRIAALQAAIGEQIRAAREEAGLTQRLLAERMSTSQAAIARLEAGGVGATVTTLQRVADTLGLTLTIELSRPAA
jgi:ribosome-binding protein aMBF1 (putative translation factor)